MCCRLFGKTSILQRKICIFGLGLSFLIISLILGVVWPFVADDLLNAQLILRQGSTSHKNWVESQLPIYLTVFLFNWTNPGDFKDPTKKPIFEEVGPYIFLEKRVRVNELYHDNGTMSFNQKRIYHFDAARSKRNLTDQIVFPHVVAASIAYNVRHNTTEIQNKYNEIINKNGGSLYIEKTVEEILFQGYSDPLLKIVAVDKPSIPDKFAWFYKRNDSETYDGKFNIGTGQENLNDLGKVFTWNDIENTGHYDGECGAVKGTTSELFPPYMNEQNPINIFLPEACRYITLKPIENFRKFEIPGILWSGREDVFDNGAKYPEMKCYCKGNSKDSEDNKCSALYPGVTDVSSCYHNAPLFMSFPHFYLGDKHYVEAVSGVEPNKIKHQFMIGIAPTIGAVLESHTRLQFNLKLEKLENFDIYRDIPESTMFPMLWYTETMNIDGRVAADARTALAMKQMGLYIAYTLIGPAIALIIAGVILTKTNSWKLPKNPVQINKWGIQPPAMKIP